MKSRRWLIPVTVTEYGRHVIIEAPSKKLAMAEYRRWQWDEMTDASDFKVTKVGAIKEDQ